MNTKLALVLVVLVLLSAGWTGCGAGEDSKTPTLVESGTEAHEDLKKASDTLDDVTDTVNEATAKLMGCSGKNGHIDRRFNNEITTAELEVAGCNTTEAFRAWCDRTDGGADFGDTGIAVCNSLPPEEE